jgi:drug/metabolite transporter (DMT)-like permease
VTCAAVNLRAAGMIAVAMTLFSGSDAIVKLLTTSLPSGQIMACRGVLVCLLFVPILLARRERPDLRALRDPANLGRGLLEVGVAWCYFNALARLPLAEATAILFVFPLLLTAAAALLLGERVRWRRWAAVLAGLAGVLVIMRPGGASWSGDALWPLAAAVCIAARDLLTRRLPPGLGSATVALTTSAIVALAGFLTLPFGWAPVGPLELGGFALSAVLVGLGFLALVEGTRRGDVSFTAPFRYLAIPLAFVMGMLVWGHVPDRWVTLGSLIVVASGLFVFYRERTLAGAGTAKRA